MANAASTKKEWLLVDAENEVIGRVASKIAMLVRGKHKPTFTPHIDTGDHVIIVNADKVVLTKNKAESKQIYRHTGYPGGIRSTTYAEALDRSPEDAVRRTIRGMLPKNRLGRQQLTKLKVYAGPTHPHQAQQPAALVLEHAKAR